jgi:hypothetical protein
MPDWLTTSLTISTYVLCAGAIVWLLVAVMQMSRALKDITDRLDDIERVISRRDR